MAILFCSHKLSRLLGITRPKTIQAWIEDDSLKWNAQLFFLNRRKCIIFMHKKTLYLFVIFDILKKDLLDFSTFFIQNLIQQLKSDNLLNPNFMKYLDEKYQKIQIESTDNDKKVIGSINDCIYRIEIYTKLNHGLEGLNPINISTRLNEAPMKPVNYHLPVEMMKEFIRDQT